MPRRALSQRARPGDQGGCPPRTTRSISVTSNWPVMSLKKSLGNTLRTARGSAGLPRQQPGHGHWHVTAEPLGVDIAEVLPLLRGQRGVDQRQPVGLLVGQERGQLACELGDDLLTSLYLPHSLAITHKTGLGRFLAATPALRCCHTHGRSRRGRRPCDGSGAQNSRYEPMTVMFSTAGGSAYQFLRLSMSSTYAGNSRSGCS